MKPVLTILAVLFFAIIAHGLHTLDRMLRQDPTDRYE
jgi:hypothetical protein